jgi:hypothetical protein
MPDFTFSDRGDFQKMVDAQIEETLTLEYKASAALTRDSKNVQELCKDVSAMANSAGGQVIYGVGEDKKTHKPTAVDDGVTDDKITREWNHQILGSNIHPRIDGLTVQRIPLSATGFGFVITVTPTQTGPHQAPDKKYYKRYELEAVAMEDYEIKDIMRRSTTPELYTELFFDGRQDTITPRITEGAQHSETVILHCAVRNRSNAPAYHVVVDFLVDYDLPTPFQVGPFMSIGARDEAPKMRIFRRVINSPPDLPIFKEGEVEQHSGVVPVQIPFEVIEGGVIYLETSIQTPGFTAREEWQITSRKGVLSFVPPRDRRKPRQRWD